MTSPKHSRIALEWSKLLGFDQIRGQDNGSSRLNDARLAKIGSKKCLITGQSR